MKKPRGNPNFLKPMKPGERTVGRAKGTPNKVSRDIKDAILRAAELSEHSKTKDLVGYMKFLADRKPETFAGLLGRMIPLQAKVQHSQAVDVNFTLNMPLSDMISSFDQQIKAATTPRIQEAPPLMIEQDVVEVES